MGILQRDGPSRRQDVAALKLKDYPGARAVLMCWRAFWPEDVEDREVESMSAAGNNNI